MLTYTLLGGVKKFRQLILVHPYAPVSGIENNIGTTVKCVVDDDIALRLVRS
ncbi:MAG: hypothetical protein IJS73_03770 [Paludibacteraceae bacterium]|nr:hypothetical protein [Paludibacteraceae bacterium]